MTIDLKDTVSIGDRLAALEAVLAETSMRVSELEVNIEYLLKADRAAYAVTESLTTSMERLVDRIYPEPMEDDAA